MKTATSYYSQGKHNEAVKAADEALPGLPLVIDHRTANATNGFVNNPWESRFGSEWHQVIKGTPELKKIRDEILC